MLEIPHGTRTRVSRRIAADPTSTALLLAAPSAVDLWPGVRRLDESDGQVVVEVPPAASSPAAAPADERQPAVVTVRALPPRRTPTSYVTRFAWSGGALPAVSGRLTLAYAPTAQGTPVTHAVLELEAERADAPYDAGSLAGMAEGFLLNLGRAAEARNRAA